MELYRTADVCTTPRYYFQGSRIAYSLCTQELRNSIGVTSHPVGQLQPRKVLQSMAKSAGGLFEACGWLNLYPSHNLSDHHDKQETWTLKTVYAEWELLEVWTRTMLSCYVHRRTTTFSFFTAGLFKSNNCTCSLLPWTYREQTWASHWLSSGIAIEKLSEKNSQQWYSAGSHSSQTC